MDAATDGVAFDLTYLVPVLPLCSLWDGVVSSLRSYSADELLGLARAASRSGYVWRSGRLRSRFGSPAITYLLGVPADAAGHG